MDQYVFTTPKGRTVHITPGIKSAAEICTWLESIVDLTPLESREAESEERGFAHALKESSRFNPHVELPENLSFISFKLMKTEDTICHIGTDPYFENNKQPIVIIEKTTGYAYCNVPKLQLELNLTRGIEEQDCREGSPLLLGYLNFCDLLQSDNY